MTRAHKEQLTVQDTLLPYVWRYFLHSYLCGFDHTTGKSYEHRRQWVHSWHLLWRSVESVDYTGRCIRSHKRWHTQPSPGNPAALSLIPGSPMRRSSKKITASSSLGGAGATNSLLKLIRKSFSDRAQPALGLPIAQNIGLARLTLTLSSEVYRTRSSRCSLAAGSALTSRRLFKRCLPPREN